MFVAVINYTVSSQNSIKSTTAIGKVLEVVVVLRAEVLLAAVAVVLIAVQILATVVALYVY